MSDSKYVFSVETLFKHKLKHCSLFVSKAKSSMYVQTMHVEMTGQKLRTNPVGLWVGFSQFLVSFFWVKIELG